MTNEDKIKKSTEELLKMINPEIFEKAIYLGYWLKDISKRENNAEVSLEFTKDGISRPSFGEDEYSILGWKDDPAISSEDKSRMIRSVIDWKRDESPDSDSGERFGAATGLASGLLLNYLMLKNSDLSPHIKALLVGATTLASGIAGGAVGNRMQSKMQPIDTGRMDFSPWKGS